jgi:hypothetical protein
MKSKATVPIASGCETENCRSQDLGFKETKCAEDRIHVILTEEILARIILECQKNTMYSFIKMIKGRQLPLTYHHLKDKCNRIATLIKSMTVI